MNLLRLWVKLKDSQVKKTEEILRTVIRHLQKD